MRSGLTSCSDSLSSFVCLWPLLTLACIPYPSYLLVQPSWLCALDKAFLCPAILDFRFTNLVLLSLLWCHPLDLVLQHCLCIDLLAKYFLWFLSSCIYGRHSKIIRPPAPFILTTQAQNMQIAVSASPSIRQSLSILLQRALCPHARHAANFQSNFGWNFLKILVWSI